MESASVDVPRVPRVVVIGDTEAVRAAVRLAVQQCGFVVRAEGPLARALELTRTYEPDLVLVVTPRPVAVADAIEDIVNGRPGLWVVVITSSRALHDVIGAARAGVAGYLPEQMDGVALCCALRHVLAGEVVIPRDIVASVHEEIRKHGIARLPGRDLVAAALTPREREVLDLLRGGLSTQEIAVLLGIAPVTVRSHIARIVRKQGVSDRYAAARGR